MILVRHASAGHKGDWPGEDLLAPAGRRGRAGRAAAGRPAGLLRSSRPGDQFARPAVHRERAPVRRELRRVLSRLEAALTLPGRASESFFRPNGPGSSPRHPVPRPRGGTRQPAVVCLHRENLPLALAAACSALGAPRRVRISTRRCPRAASWSCTWPPGRWSLWSATTCSALPFSLRPVSARPGSARSRCPALSRQPGSRQPGAMSASGAVQPQRPYQPAGVPWPATSR